MNKRQVRSSGYQWIIVETVYPTEMLEAFSNQDSIYKRLNPFDYNDEVMQLEEQLKKEFWRVVEDLLTPRQKQVIRLCADGYTQQEIAKTLNVNQSSITKSLNGNKCYDINKLDNGKKGNTVYGGCKKKLRKIIEQDEKIQVILKKIAELRDEEW
jgi:DNA-binding CsgD family transcriptional regulator